MEDTHTLVSMIDHTRVSKAHITALPVLEVFTCRCPEPDHLFCSLDSLQDDSQIIGWSLRYSSCHIRIEDTEDG
jgi:hypothetical protein